MTVSPGRKASKRPEFNHMIAVAKQNPSPFSAIMVWKFSRFARNQEEAIYKGMLKNCGIDVISTSEPMIDGPFSSIERIIEWFDEYYYYAIPRLNGYDRKGQQRW